MKVILRQDIPHMGKKYDIKDVNDGYARNFLLPRNLALIATPRQLDRMKQSEDAASMRKEKEAKEYRTIAEKLASLALTIKTNIGEKGKAFGSVSNRDITDALTKEGVTIQSDWIEQKQPIKTTGKHEVEIKLPHGVRTKLTVTVTAA